jgi:hypothetical protein
VANDVNFEFVDQPVLEVVIGVVAEPEGVFLSSFAFVCVLEDS